MIFIAWVVAMYSSFVMGSSHRSGMTFFQPSEGIRDLGRTSSTLIDKFDRPGIHRDSLKEVSRGSFLVGKVFVVWEGLIEMISRREVEMSVVSNGKVAVNAKDE